MSTVLTLAGLRGGGRGKPPSRSSLPRPRSRRQHGGRIAEAEVIKGLDSPKLDELLGDQAEELRIEIDVVKGASHEFSLDAYLAGAQTPVFFGSAISNFGILELLDAFAEFAPPPLPREAEQRTVHPEEEKFTGFVFKIQPIMDPAHRDRVPFMRICSGKFDNGMKIHHVRIGKAIQVANAITFQADTRKAVEEAYPGASSVCTTTARFRCGDTFTMGETSIRIHSGVTSMRFLS